MTWRTVLTLIICRSVFRLLASLAGRGLPNFALVWLAGLLICQEVAQVAIHAVPVSVTGLAVWTLSRCAIKGLAQSLTPLMGLQTVSARDTRPKGHVHLQFQTPTPPHPALHVKLSVNSYPKLHSWHWLCAVRLLGPWHTLQAPLGPSSHL